MNDQQYQYDAILEHKGGRAVFVETGSALGETTAFAVNHFDQIITIEYQDNYYHRCVERFFHTPSVTVLHGDSADMIKLVKHNTLRDSVFWLDAHYDGGDEDAMAPSGETPVLEELTTILGHPGRHAILVDDARLFGQGGYPTLETVEALAAPPGYSFEVRDDIIRMIR